MTGKNFVKKFFSLYLWGNILAMAVIVLLLSIGLKYGLDLYTHHGQKVPVPNVIHKTYSEAEDLLDAMALTVVVSDTDYVKTLPPDCVLEQSPTAGDTVKPGRIVYLKINASHSPSYPVPDIIENSSLRDAQAKLLAIGFKLGDPEYIPGEKEWVYGLKCRGRSLKTGDMVSVEDVLIIQVGDGRRDLNMPIVYTEPAYLGEADDDEEENKKPRTHYQRKAEPRTEAPSRPVMTEQAPPTESRSE